MRYLKPLILIIDDDAAFTQDLVFVLQQEFTCISAHSGAEGLEQMKQQSPAALLLDLMIGEHESGLDVLARAQQEDPHLPVIMITGHESVETAVEAMKRGAFSYISKRTHTDELVVLLQKAIESKKIRDHAQTLAEEVRQGYGRIIGNSPAVESLRHKITLFANTPQTVLITGESGTGKELVARSIHNQSDRKNRPFVAVNCAAIPRELIESELFGHEAGSFTGAHKRKLGKLEIAGDGIIFFDEIGDLDPSAQSKLLRVLETREFERVGGVKLIPTNARVVAATNVELQEAMKKGEFREDLFYRLESLTLHVPALRERKQDIPELVDHFLLLTCNEMKSQPKTFNPEAMEAFIQYSWPGNIRELRNAVTSAAITASGNVIDLEHLNPRILSSGQPLKPAAYSPAIKPSTKLNPDVIPESWEEMDKYRKEAEELAGREVERAFLERLMNRFDGNVAAAANSIGINRSNLYRMMKRCGMG